MFPHDVLSSHVVLLATVFCVSGVVLVCVLVLLPGARVGVGVLCSIICHEYFEPVFPLSDGSYFSVSGVFVCFSDLPLAWFD